jgi:hypothetical protein
MPTSAAEMFAAVAMAAEPPAGKFSAEVKEMVMAAAAGVDAGVDAGVASMGEGVTLGLTLAVGDKDGLTLAVGDTVGHGKDALT